jgi:GH18 family chitinase
MDVSRALFILTFFKMRLSEWNVDASVATKFAHKDDKWLSFADKEDVRKMGEYARRKGIAGVSVDTLDMDMTRDKQFPHANELFRAFLGDSTSEVYDMKSVLCSVL